MLRAHVNPCNCQPESGYNKESVARSGSEIDGQKQFFWQMHPHACLTAGQPPAMLQRLGQGLKSNLVVQADVCLQRETGLNQNLCEGSNDVLRALCHLGTQ